jgi:hypothetical protein
VQIVNAETRYERRNLFGPVRFIKHIVVTFNDFCTAERLLVEFIKRTKQADSNESLMDTSQESGKYFNNNNFYLELPSSFEMRKVMSVCRELKADENIANIYYAQDSIRVMMKKSDPNDKDEIPKKFDVTNLHEIHNEKCRHSFETNLQS